MGEEQPRVRARSWWWAAAGSAGVVGCVAALFTVPASSLVASAVFFAAFSLLFVVGLRSGGPERAAAGGTVDGDWRGLVDRALVGTAGGIATLGLLQVSVAATAVVALVLGATAPWALSRRRDGVTPERPADPLPTVDRPVPDEPPTGGGADLRAATTDDLVLAWRRSCVELPQARTPEQLAAVAERRQRLLDELERRDAQGVERWLRAGARAAGDPTPFLQRPDGPSAAAA